MSLTQFSLRSLQPVSCRFLAHVCAFSPGLMVMMVMARVMVMVMLMVTVRVPKALTQVGWLAMSTSMSKFQLP
jgi:hypothetical protein